MKRKGINKMESRRKKMIAPIVITILLILYYVIYFIFLMAFLDGIWKYVLVIIPLVVSAMLIKVCLERIKEIRTGEEDDLSKY